LLHDILLQSAETNDYRPTAFSPISRVVFARVDGGDMSWSLNFDVWH